MEGKHNCHYICAFINIKNINDMEKTKFAQKYIEHKKSNFKHNADYPAMFYKSKLRAFFTILKSDIKQFNSHKHPYDITNAFPRILTNDLDCLISILESTLSYCKYLRNYVHQSR